MILFRYAARRVLGAFLVALAGVVGIFLAVDFVDNAGAYGGPGATLAVLELYLNKAAVVVSQVAPAAMLLGTAVATSTWRQTREYTALRSVGLGPWRLAVPVMVVMLVVGGALIALHDVVGVRAAERAEEISSLRFGRGGDERRFRAAREPKRWFRSADGKRIYHLRGSLPGGGFEHVTVLEVAPDFTLARRIDAARMRPAGPEWILEDVEDRTFAPDGSMALARAARRQVRFDEPPDAFAIVPGRPTQMRFTTLGPQIALRERLGLPSAEFELERSNRLAYPLAGVPGALLAISLALRPGRKGHIAAALIEAVGISLLFWGAQGVSWAMGLSGRVTPWVAAWAPNALFLVVGAIAVRRAR